MNLDTIVRCYLARLAFLCRGQVAIFMFEWDPNALGDISILLIDWAAGLLLGFGLVIDDGELVWIGYTRE